MYARNHNNKNSWRTLSELGCGIKPHARKYIPASHPSFVCAVDLSSQLDFRLADFTAFREGSSSALSRDDDGGPALR